MVSAASGFAGQLPGGRYPADPMRIPLHLAALLAAVALAAAACGDTAQPTITAEPPLTQASTTTSAAPSTTTTTSTTPPTTARPTTSTTAAPTTTTSTTTTTVPEGVVAIDVDVYEGQVDADDRIAVTIDDEVTLTVTADVSDEVHVHGYDIFGDVAPGAPAVLEFVADIPGIFEVELEDAHLVLFELVVEP